MFCAESRHVIHQAMHWKMCFSFTNDYRDYNNTHLFLCVQSPRVARANYAKQHMPTLHKIYRCYDVGFSITRGQWILCFRAQNLNEKRLLVSEIFNIEKCSLSFGTEYTCTWTQLTARAVVVRYTLFSLIIVSFSRNFRCMPSLIERATIFVCEQVSCRIDGKQQSQDGVEVAKK